MPKDDHMKTSLKTIDYKYGGHTITCKSILHHDYASD